MFFTSRTARFLFSLFDKNKDKRCSYAQGIITLIGQKCNEYSTIRNRDCLYVNFIKHLDILFKLYTVFNKMIYFFYDKQTDKQTIELLTKTKLPGLVESDDLFQISES